MCRCSSNGGIERSPACSRGIRRTAANSGSRSRQGEPRTAINGHVLFQGRPRMRAIRRSLRCCPGDRRLAERQGALLAEPRVGMLPRVPMRWRTRRTATRRTKRAPVPHHPPFKTWSRRGGGPMILLRGYSFQQFNSTKCGSSAELGRLPNLSIGNAVVR